MNMVSIIMPYYKKRIFFLLSLESALNQTFQNFEIIIIYDDSDMFDLDYILEKQKTEVKKQQK